MSDKVVDADGREIKVGTRIAPYFHEGKMTCPGGVVTKVTEADGDIDEYGRSYQIGPLVHVKYDDGIEDEWMALHQWISDEYVCDDVEVVDEAS